MIDKHANSAYITVPNKNSIGGLTMIISIPVRKTMLSQVTTMHSEFGNYSYLSLSHWIWQDYKQLSLEKATTN